MDREEKEEQRPKVRSQRERGSYRGQREGRSCRGQREELRIQRRKSYRDQRTREGAEKAEQRR